MLSKQELEEIRLKPEESTRLNTFIGNSVRSNEVYPVYSNKVGGGLNKPVQDIYALNEATLSEMSGILDKKIKDYTPVFNPRVKQAGPFKVGNVSGADLLDALTLILREKVYFAEQKAREKHLLNLQEQLNEAKTPKERRKELEAELQAFTA